MVANTLFATNVKDSLNSFDIILESNVVCLLMVNNTSILIIYEIFIHIRTKKIVVTIFLTDTCTKFSI